MSFVQWFTLAALALIAAVGLYNGLRAIITRKFDYPPLAASGRGVIWYGLLYLAGAGVALFAIWLLLFG